MKNRIDPRMDEPAFGTFPWQTCVITTPEGDEYPGYISRGNEDENGVHDFFEAARVFACEYRGREVLVDYYHGMQPYRVFIRNKKGQYRTKRSAKHPRTGKPEGIFTAVITKDPRPVYSYLVHAFPEELLEQISPETAEGMRELERSQVESFVAGTMFPADIMAKYANPNKEN